MLLKNSGPVIESATAGELAAVKALLLECGLPIADIQEESGFLLARNGSEICATVGFEHFGETALLRSLAVRQEHRRKGLGRRLCEQGLRTARRSGVKTVYLLTTNAQNFFRKLGFNEVPKDAAPASIQATAQFRTICPASATLMSRVA